jgi:pilus assembly protein Flp/PilA
MYMLGRPIHELRLLEEETGASAVEYGLLVALIAVVIMTAVGVLGVNMSEVFQAVADAVGGA